MAESVDIVAEHQDNPRVYTVGEHKESTGLNRNLSNQNLWATMLASHLQWPE